MSRQKSVEVGKERLGGLSALRILLDLNQETSRCHPRRPSLKGSSPRILPPWPQTTLNNSAVLIAQTLAPQPNRNLKMPSKSSSSQSSPNSLNPTLASSVSSNKSSLAQKKETPVASHNYFSNYQANRTPQVQVQKKQEMSGMRPQTASNMGRKKSVASQLGKDLGKEYQQQMDYLIPPKKEEHYGKKTLVLDLDETLVHSQFKAIEKPDIILPIEIENQVYDVYVLKRPGLEDFLRKMAPLYEIVVFTASLSKYADPLLNIIDKYGYCSYRLFREHCTFNRGSFVKDLERLGRPLNEVIIVDNAPASYLFQPQNAYPCLSWYDDMKDRQLYDMVPILESIATVDDVRIYLRAISAQDRVLYSQAKIIISREKRREKERKMLNEEKHKEAQQQEYLEDMEKQMTQQQKQYMAQTHQLKAEEFKADVIKNSWVQPYEEEKPFGLIHSMPQGMQDRRTSTSKGESVNQSSSLSQQKHSNRPHTANASSRGMRNPSARGTEATTQRISGANQAHKPKREEHRMKGSASTGAIVKTTSTTANQPRDFFKKKNSMNPTVDIRSSYSGYPGQISKQSSKPMVHSHSAQALDNSKSKQKYKNLGPSPSNYLQSHAHFKNNQFMKMPRSGSTGDFTHGLRKSSHQDDSGNHSNMQTNQGDMITSNSSRHYSDPQSIGAQNSRKSTPKPQTATIQVSRFASSNLYQDFSQGMMGMMTSVATPQDAKASTFNQYSRAHEGYTNDSRSKRPSQNYMQSPKNHYPYNRLANKKTGAKTPKQTLPLKKPEQLRSSDMNFMRPYQEALYQKFVERRSAAGYYMQPHSPGSQYLQQFKSGKDDTEGILAEGTVRPKLEPSGSFKSKTQPLSIRECLREKIPNQPSWN